MQSMTMSGILRDTRGSSEFVSAIILVVAVALFGLAAYKKFGKNISDKVEETGQEVMKIK